MLVIRNVSKSLNNNQILKQVNLSVEPKERVAVIGKNGAGKTTLFKTVVGVMKQDSGFIHLDGVDLYEQPSYRKNIGYVPVESFFYENLTVRENMELIGVLFGVKSLQERIEQLSRMTRIDSFININVSDLSSGMKKKVSLAAALIHEPKLIVMDEPFNALDVASHALFYETVLNTDSSVLFTSHIPETIYDLADRICILRNGEICNEFVFKNQFEDLGHFKKWYVSQIEE